MVWRQRMRSNDVSRLSDTMSCCCKLVMNFRIYLEEHLEYPGLVTELLLVFINVGLSDVISRELHV